MSLLDRLEGSLSRRQLVGAVSLWLLAGAGCLGEAPPAGEAWSLEVSAGGDRAKRDVTTITKPDPRPDAGAVPGDEDGGISLESLTRCGGSLEDIETRFAPEAGDTVTSKLALGPTGCPNVTFYQNDRIKYARWTGDGWEIQQIAEVEPGNWTQDIAIDAEGNATLMYVRGERDQLFYARRGDDGGWTETSIETPNYVQALDHQITPDGRPVALAIQTEQKNTYVTPSLVFYERRRGTWERSEVYEDPSGQMTALIDALEYDARGRPHVAVAAGSRTQTLVFGYRPSGSGDWTVDTIDDLERGMAGNVALAIDGRHRPHLLYCGDRQAPQLRHAVREAGGWRHRKLESLDHPCSVLNAYVDESGSLRGAYAWSAPNSVKMSFRFGGMSDGDGWRPLLDTAIENRVVRVRVDERLGVLHVVGRLRGDDRIATYRTLQVP